MSPITIVKTLTNSQKNLIITLLFIILPFLIAGLKPVIWPPDLIRPISGRVDSISMQVDANTKALEELHRSADSYGKFFCYSDRHSAILANIPCNRLVGDQ